LLPIQGLNALTKKESRDAAAWGVSRAPLTATEEARIRTQLARRFGDFMVPDNASKADVIDALVAHLLNRQRRW
jgi:hypothetical protein